MQEDVNENLKKIREARKEAKEKRLREVRKQKMILGIVSFAVIALLAGLTVFLILKNKNKEGQGKDGNVTAFAEGEKNSNGKATEEKTTEEVTTEATTEATTEDPGVNTTIKLTFVGDCMLASYMGEYYEGNFNWYADNYPTTYFFDEVRDIFEADDFTIANCENVFTDDDTIPEREKPWKTKYWFKSKAKNAQIFSDNSIEAVTIANNHLYDYCDEGAEDTKEALDAAGVLWGYDDKIVYLEKDGYTLGLVCISFCGFNGGGGNLEEANTKLQYLDMAKENSDFQIVYFHGGTEGSFETDSWVKEMAKIYIDDGADLIIGAHPHRLQPCDEYNGVDIVYSLGNFCFGGNSYPQNRTAIYQYEITIEKDEIVSKEHNIIPCYVFTGDRNNWKPKPISDEAKVERVIKFMNGECSTPE